ncbi:MAG: FAD-binding oxidoreductase [Paludibacteraceae bacterium]|nr:FAD-binding oxidoreductase [Paludibacteraceae bacterium]
MINDFLKEIKVYLREDNIYTDDLRLLAWGTDASFYRLIPKIAIQTSNEWEISFLLQKAAKYNLPVTFRAAGTSLSGQSLSDSVLIIAGQHWQNFEVLNNGNAIRLQPGIIGERVNEILKPYGKKFSPDPASIKSAMIGGILANNASGMSCGIRENSYQMLVSARIVFADGAILDTSDEQSKNNFIQTHADFLREIERIRDEIKNDEELYSFIKKKYEIKNVTGLSLQPFVDFEDPFDIILHLMVGSEGTLGFVSEAVFKTTDNCPYSASGFAYFENMHLACQAVQKLKNLPVSAVEFFDRKAIASVEDKFNNIPELKCLPADGAALLIKIESDDEEILHQRIDQVENLLSNAKVLFPVHFTDQPDEYNAYWDMRSGIFPTVGSTRPSGTTCLIEDVCFRMENLADATDDLDQILLRNHYEDAVIYGHALAGNLHFIISQRFDNEENIHQYETMMNEVVNLVVNKYHGSLKAEHGTGRNIAPFVSKEWGEKAYGFMKRIKQLFDPQGILNPEVIFNEHPRCYVENIKPLPNTHPLIDKCIECGFCEVNCVSAGFTISSRQRIVVQREIARLKATKENPKRLKKLEKEFLFMGNQSCATDGLCATSCPVEINVGDYVHYLREEQLKNKKVAQFLGKWTAEHFHLVANSLRSVLSLAYTAEKILGKRAMSVITRGLRVISGNTFPFWSPALPKPQHKIIPPPISDNPLKVVYFPSCLNQMMSVSSNDPEQTPLIEKMISFLNKAGYDVIFPKNMEKMCCGSIWESKGLLSIADQKSSELEKALLEASENGRYPVLCDQSPCLFRMRQKMHQLSLYEPVEFIDKFLLDKLEFYPIDEPITIHATCSTTKMGLKPTLIKIAKLCSKQVLIPEEVGCCAFAGDKGFMMPELNAHALRKLRPQIEKSNVKTGYSNSRTCEIGLNTNTGIPYMSIVYLVDKCTKRKEL